MPYKARKPCARQGCPKLTESRYCEAHDRAEAKRYNKYDRDPDSGKRYGRAWKRIRDRYITAHPLCEECEIYGRLTPAAEVHHMVSLSEGGTHDETNLMALCTSCHSAITTKAWAKRKRR